MNQFRPTPNSRFFVAPGRGRRIKKEGERYGGPDVEKGKLYDEYWDPTPEVRLQRRPFGVLLAISDVPNDVPNEETFVDDPDSSRLPRGRRYSRCAWEWASEQGMVG
ncbi:MAG: hypothetical protein COV29_02925 [Candidatus Yanofskybacteria bacterium CG10_big_fil_rev_8_21_14_0_10_36_16]|uniref:Uncharacterized protein n=1 Tax=Candidatus Yanofskybacteria bacterium CG10_big_fil_rev_8_21_14_0_10_36_16 TaxID=1975096 RepID=A0A2J0Q6T6_9BACT|nr:MAG: hypothetical protein COV29_02925 [Candidatus Yanofskybacteria bacterium CG10_big_fil_rev_8_21_14_0_10_36_16]